MVYEKLCSTLWYTRSSLSKTLAIPESGIVASSIEPGSNAEQVQNGRTHQKEANSLHQDPQYEKQELKTALLLMSNGSSMHWVIKMVMKMDDAEPFNVPVDPVALAIPSKSSRKHDGGGVAAKLRILRVRVKSEKDLGRKDKDSKEKERVLEKKIHETEVTVDGEERQGKRGRENTGKEYLPDGRFIVSADRDFKIRTFTLSNLGMFGVDRFDAILPLGQGAIMAARASKPTAIIGFCLQRLAKKAKNFQGISYSKLANLPPIVGLYSSFVGCRFLCEDSHILLLLLLHGMQIFMSKLMMMFINTGRNFGKIQEKATGAYRMYEIWSCPCSEGVRYHELESWKFGEVGNRK
ncbi:unnamed protein product [Camellia sinensis]